MKGMVFIMKKHKPLRDTIIIVIIAISLVFLVDYSKGRGVVRRLEDWKDKHPVIYDSYMANADMSKTKYGGSVAVDYLEEHPNLKTFYDGYGFSIEYARARGHVYALDDLINTARPKGAASCLSCKSADFHIAIENEGSHVNKMDFDQFLKEHPETATISCYDCHRNKPGQISITRAHLSDALLHSNENLSPQNQVCAQCHTEYYQDTMTKEVVLPWHNGLGTDGMLDYYDEINFSDWEHPTTHAGLLKAQHPEFETFDSSIHYKMGLSCIDCHMPKIAGSDNLKSHHWTSPLKSTKGLEASCLDCHLGSPEELIARVEGVQEEVYIKTNEVSDELHGFIGKLALAVEKDNIAKEDLNRLQDIHRRAQFKWDFVFVENGEGFHNSEKAHKNLDEARVLIEEGMAILEKYD